MKEEPEEEGVVTKEEEKKGSSLVKYIPEKDYESNNYKAIGSSNINMCIRCKDYYAKIHAAGLTKKPFPPKCKGHILDVLDFVKEDDFELPEEFETFRIALDPVAWAYRYFAWEARFYQEEMMDCTASMKVARCGRRCLKEGTMVATPFGPIAIEKMRIGDEVYNENGSVIKVTGVYDQGLQEVVDLINHNKVIATSTLDHRWWVYNERYPNQPHNLHTEDLTKRFRISRQEFSSSLGPVDEPYAYILGAFAGDGCCRSNQLTISSNDEVIVSHIGKILEEPYRKCTGNFSWTFKKATKSKIPHYNKWLDGRYAHEKILDFDVLKSWNRRSLLFFVAGLIDTDGSVTDLGNEIKISISMQAKPYIEAIQYAFLALWGIDKGLELDDREKYKNGPLYCFSLKHIYHCKRVLKELSPYLQLERKKYKPIYDTYIPHNFNPLGIGVKFGDVYEARTWDLEVDSPNSLYLLANGLVTHNTGKTTAIVILILWMLSVNQDYSVLVIAPYEAQVTKIFDEMTKLLQTSPELSASIKRQTKSPNRIEFMNGSKALGFSSGSKSAARSDKVRGQDANFIVLDEADYLDEQDIDAILAILASHPDCGLWASSTPTGQHSKFFQWCRIKDLGFKEFWYISPEAPNWTDDIEEFFKTSVDSITYDHEYNAEFGIQITGVFRNDLVDRALLDYSLPRTRTPGSKICIGVDWNGQAVGTHIIVTEAVLDGMDNFKYLTIDRRVIKGGEFTQHAAVEEIIAMNEMYNPEFIYVDAGYGETQIEMLHKYGKNNPHTRLHKKVKAYTMGSTIEIKDPHTKQPIKKPAKPFMVNTAVLQLEQNRVILPTSEDTQVLVDSTDSKEAGQGAGFVQQMRNFCIERVSVSGLPTYSQGNEHALTAWMLSLCAFVLELSDLKGRASFSAPRLITTSDMLRPSIDNVPSKEGQMLSNAARNLGLDMDTKTEVDAEKRKLSHGDQKILSRYYGKKNIDRTSGMRTNWWEGQRGGGQRRGGRGF